MTDTQEKSEMDELTALVDALAATAFDHGRHSHPASEERAARVALLAAIERLHQSREDHSDDAVIWSKAYYQQIASDLAIRSRAGMFAGACSIGADALGADTQSGGFLNGAGHLLAREQAAGLLVDLKRILIQLEKGSTTPKPTPTGRRAPNGETK